MDNKVLEKKTVDAYNYLRDIIIAKKKDEYFSLVFNSDLRYVQSNYYSRAELKETAAEDLFNLRFGKYNAEKGGVHVRFLRILLYMPEGKDTFEIW